MRIHKGYLFWGIFFLLLGAIPLAERDGLVEPERIGDLARFWPVAIIALGVSVVIARTRVALVGTIASALILGGVVGGAIASGGGLLPEVGDCATAPSESTGRTTRVGTFGSRARVDLHLDCGSVEVRAGAAVDALGQWLLDARHRGDAAPIVEATAASLRVRPPEGAIRRQDWQLALPPGQIGKLGVSLNAASALVDVTGASLDSLAVAGNAADIRVLAAGATLERLALELNAGRARLVLGGDTTGTIAVNAGAVDICVPPTSALTIQLDDHFAFVTNLEQRGLTRTGDVWTRDGSGGPTIDLRVDGTAATFSLDPAGGCDGE